MSSVTVYYLPGCPFAAKLRLTLRVACIRFDAVAFREDEAAAAEVRAHNDGAETSPTVRVGDLWLTNPSLREVRRAMTASQGSSDLPRDQTSP